MTAAQPILAGGLVLPGIMSRGLESDGDLVRRARAGDLPAFEELYRRHIDKIFGLCLRMVANRAWAEDLSQESFVRAWQKLASFRGQSAFATWLHRLTVNVVLGDLRGSHRRQKHLEAEPPESRPTVSSHLGQAVDLERAIASLPQRARKVFLLYDVEGYRHREIAALTGISEGTSKAHLHRARKLLREALRP